MKHYTKPVANLICAAQNESIATAFEGAFTGFDDGYVTSYDVSSCGSLGD